jgi:hypothetical protein
MRFHARPPLVVLAPLLAACASDPAGPEQPVPVARVDSVTVDANEHMVVSAVVRFDARGDSARVRYRVAGAATDSVTAVRPGPLDRDTIVVLGLLPDTRYEFRVVVHGGSGAGADSVVSDAVVFTTGAPPPDLPAYAAGPSTAGPGYFAFSAGEFGLVIDRTGRVVWYRRFPAPGPGLNFMAQPTGTFVGRLATADTTDDDPMAEIDAAGNVRRMLRCVNRRLRFHDLLLLSDGSYWIMCDDTRTQDLTAQGGVAAASVTGTTLQHVSAAGTLLFEWNPFEHFLITDLDSASYAGSSVNWTHGNSFDLDTDGNLLVSFRSLNEITKIDATTGAVLWRMGGRRNQFAFAGGPDPGFSRQHNVRVVGPGRFILLDNVGAPESRYERYAWDAATRTATLEQSYGSSPGVQTAIGGSVQQSGTDRYVVSFGTEGRVEEFDAAGTTLWTIAGDPGYVFRAQRILSLDRPVPVVTR